jgi:hypothetical protein
VEQSVEILRIVSETHREFEKQRRATMVHIRSLIMKRSILNLLAAVCATIVSVNVPMAQADTALKARGTVAHSAEGGTAARSSLATRGSHGALAGNRGLVANGEGNAAGGATSGFTTDSGGQGLRARKFKRSDDGSFNASGQSRASGANGSADRSGSFTRNADGTASGEQSTTMTNANTGVTFDASTTYDKGSGASRSASCKDASGSTVPCFSR